MTLEKFRKEEQFAIDRLEKAFENRQNAFREWRKKLLHFPGIQQGDDTLRNFENAEDEWSNADADIKRIVEEFRSGKRY